MATKSTTERKAPTRVHQGVEDLFSRETPKKKKKTAAEQESTQESQQVEVPEVTTESPSTTKSTTTKKETRKSHPSESQESEQSTEPQVQPAPMRKMSIAIRGDTALRLRREVHALKDVYDVDGPDRNHFADLGIMRLLDDLQGDDKEDIIRELLALKQDSKRRQGPPRKK